MEKSVSFRTHLQSNTTDLLSEDGMIPCIYTIKFITNLVSQMAAYTEEGVSLAPAVFVCNSVTNLVRMAGAGEHFSLSTSVATETAASKVLKAAAPLCMGCWRIYVERDQDGKSCRFGVFCGSTDPSSFTVDEALLESSDKDFPIIRIQQSATNKVEVRTSVGSSIEFRFNDDVDASQQDATSKIGLLSSIASQRVNEDQASFALFVQRILKRAIRRSHGTLIAVVTGETPAELSDGLFLDVPLDLYGRYQLHFKEDRTAVSVSRLHSAAELLEGFVNSDGITVLDMQGRVLGYRAFIKSRDPDSPSDGGARTRAFQALRALVGSGLEAAFFRSQDGRTELAQVEKDSRDA